MAVVVVFTSVRTQTHRDEYASMAAEMEQRVAGYPGFQRMESVRDPSTGRGVTVAWFEDHEAVRAWRVDAEHAEAQRRGKQDFYQHYTVTVADVVREYEGPR
jgi:heme-degrading monooxygenase HmoA